jgi:pimeloyl-ACP methyl ester carboxylesterase
VIERAHVYGSHDGLLGVLCEPAGGLRPERPVAVCANVGLNHRVGPNRLWVELARRLAAAGYATLRFDLSGFGDSLPRRDSGGDLERAVLDLREALDFLEAKKGARRFVLVANCSGTDSQHALALRDPRVVGTLTIDGYAYRDGLYWLHRALRVFQPARFARRARQRRLERERARREPGQPRQEVWTRDIPAREIFARDLETLAARGVQSFLLFTSGADLRYNHRAQFHRMFGRRDTVEVAWDCHADHLLSTAADREVFLAQAVDWMRRRFPPGEGA